MITKRNFALPKEKKRCNNKSFLCKSLHIREAELSNSMIR